MIDRIFFAAFTFCLLVSGTLLIGSVLIGIDPLAAAHARTGIPGVEVQVVQLPRVLTVAKRVASPSAVARMEAREPTSRIAQ